LLLFLFASPARSQDPNNCDVQVNAGHALISPLGEFPSLSSQGLTITVTIRDGLNQPIQGVTNDRITLGSQAGTLVFCPTDNYADGSTDASGQTTFSGSMTGGGFAQDLRVYIDGLEIPVPLALEVNGPDLSQDLQIDLVDLSNLAQDIELGPVIFRSDLWRDNLLDLADAVLFMTSYTDVGPCVP